MYRKIRIGLMWFALGVQLTCGTIAAGEWRTEAPLNTPRSGAAAVVLDGQIYVLGGKTSNGTVLNTVERFDPATGAWDATSVAAFDRPRFKAAAIVLNDSIYIIGGRSDENEVLKKMEVYDPGSNTWEEVKQMDNEREEHVAVLLRGSICVIGGKDEYGDPVLEIEWYNETEDEWFTAISSLSYSKQSPFATAINDTVYLFGGFNPLPAISNFKGVTDPGWFFTWDPLPLLQAGRGYGATGLLNERIFIMGGRTLNDTTDTIEIFNLQSQDFDPGDTLPTPRAGMPAVTLNNEIYVIGGISGQNEYLSLVEVYSEAVAIDPPAANIPGDFAQISGYPNPFNGVIQLEIKIPQRGSNQIGIYDLQGRRIKSIYTGNLSAGTHTFRWEGKNELNLPVSTGLYFAVLKGNSYLRSFKVVYVK